MNKEKFMIPMPEDMMVNQEIKTIIQTGLKKKQTFPSFLLHLYKQIGFRYLFVNPFQGILMMISIVVAIIFLFSTLATKTHESYLFVFLFSPLLFMALSFYDMFHKKHQTTFEVEMVTKYNVYQMSAFRMFNFSVISIIINTIMIVPLVWNDENLSFFKTFMISNTALFLFSIIFLFVFMKRSRGVSAIIVCLSWIGFNLLLNRFTHQAYVHLLETIPIFVYAIVLASSICLYMHYLKKLVRMKPVEGVL